MLPWGGWVSVPMSPPDREGLLSLTGAFHGVQRHCNNKQFPPDMRPPASHLQVKSNFTGDVKRSPGNSKPAGCGLQCRRVSLQRAVQGGRHSETTLRHEEDSAQFLVFPLPASIPTPVWDCSGQGTEDSPEAFKQPPGLLAQPPPWHGCEPPTIPGLPARTRSTHSHTHPRQNSHPQSLKDQGQPLGAVMRNHGRTHRQGRLQGCRKNKTQRRHNEMQEE